MSINKELSDRVQFQSENNIRHLPFSQEMQFYSAVRNGDINKVRELFTPLAQEGYGVISSDPIQNIKYHLVITIAMLTRFCIEGGLPAETAYTISDIYINRMDNCADERQLAQIHQEVVFDFTKRMQLISSGDAYSKHVVRCIDIIYENIYSGVTVSMIAQKLGLTPQYISKIFKKEVGITIFEFIMSRRIQAAENMLKFSEYSSVEIANYMNFSSHSHFISVFRKYTGMTPKQYRDKYFRTNYSPTDGAEKALPTPDDLRTEGE